MTLLVNGDLREMTASSVAQVVSELGLQPEVTLVEHNGLALRREEWPRRTLRSGDRLEIIRIVAGG